MLNDRQSRQEYKRRVDAVQDFIEREINSPLPLERLAGVADFSKYHFHRIFSAITGETVLQFVNRIKLERSAYLLLNQPDMSITDIALYYGFSDSAVYARAFRSHFACSPSQYREKDSKNCKEGSRILPYDIDTGTGNFKKGRDLMKAMPRVEIAPIDEMRVIYIRYTGPYEGLSAELPRMQQTLFGFAAARNLLIPNKTKILSIYHDNHEIADTGKLRTSFCMTVPVDSKIDLSHDIGSMVLSGTYAIGHFEVLKSEYGEAWAYMYRGWLPDSGCQPRDTFPFEVYVSEPSNDPSQIQSLDIYLPVEPLD